MHESNPRHRDDVEAEGWPQDDFSGDLGHGVQANDTGAPDEATRPLAHHEAPALGDVLTETERERLYVLRTGATLRQGSTYLDLANREAGPFVAIGGQTAASDQLLLSKRAADFELWNKLAAEREPTTERP